MAHTFAFVSLGCDKNTVDTEVMIGMLQEAGFQLRSDESEAELIIINTCCFIQDAKEESIENIIDVSEYKKTGNCKGIIVTGCLAERYKEEIQKELPEVDGVLGTGSLEKIVEVAKEVLQGQRAYHMEDIHAAKPLYQQRVLTTPGYYGYLKIAEGCDNCCTYCVIPSVRGKYRSFPMEDLVKQAGQMVEKGVKEILIVAQDITQYGEDLYGEKMLPALLKKLCLIENLHWIRLLYCYSESITDELIDVMAAEEKICKYIDMPIQHGDDTVLKRMGRRNTGTRIRETVNKLRKKMPYISIRTTIITGFPGETEEQFNTLRQLIEEIEFDRLGAFTYSLEEGTPAALFPDQIEDSIKEKRREKLMLLQQKISFEKNKDLVGRTLEVIIDGRIPEDGVYCGRSYRDAPDIDGLVFIQTDEELLSGDLIPVKITEASEYDLIGVIVDELSQ